MKKINQVLNILPLYLKKFQNEKSVVIATVAIVLLYIAINLLSSQTATTAKKVASATVQSNTVNKKQTSAKIATDYLVKTIPTQQINAPTKKNTTALAENTKIEIHPTSTPTPTVASQTDSTNNSHKAIVTNMPNKPNSQPTATPTPTPKVDNKQAQNTKQTGQHCLLSSNNSCIIAVPTVSIHL